MYYLFHGPDNFSCSEEIAKLKRQVGAADVADLNISTLDGRSLTLAELVHVCDALPFLSDRRLVIVEGLASRFSGSKGRQTSQADKELLARLEAYIPKLPDTTDLVLVEGDLLGPKHPLVALASQKGAGHLKAFPLLKERELAGWISARARSKGVQIDAQAVRELALYVGNDLRLLDNELTKLATYAGEAQSVRVEDVRRLVSYVREESVFELVDALGQRNASKALRLFHQMLEEDKNQLFPIFGMIVRQFRLLLQAKSMMGQRAALPQIMKELGLRDFVADKMVAQARNFSLEQLMGIYRELQRVDVAIKTGQVEPELALDVFVAEVCGEGPVRTMTPRRGAMAS